MRYEENIYRIKSVGDIEITINDSATLEGEPSEIPLSFIAEMLAEFRKTEMIDYPDNEELTN